MTRDGAAADAIDEIREKWEAIRPDLDYDTIEIVGRLLRAATVIDRETGVYLAAAGLNRGEFDVLTALRRAGEPQTPGSLRTVSLASAAAITKRVQSLERAGLVERHPNPDDGRGALVYLTSRGQAAVDQAFPDMLAIERRLLAGLSPAQRSRAIAVLRQVLHSAETEAPTSS
jgi:DNA-binding MarR family transcriptional regulator